MSAYGASLKTIFVVHTFVPPKWEIIIFTISKIGKPHHDVVQKDTANQELRVLLASIHHWSPKWVFAEPLHLLCQSEEIVR